MLYGRATDEGMASYWTKATGPTADILNDVPKVVLSRTLQAATWKYRELPRMAQFRSARETPAWQAWIQERHRYGVKRSLVARAGVELRPPTAYNRPLTPPTPSAARAVGIVPRLVHALATGS